MGHFTKMQSVSSPSFESSREKSRGRKYWSTRSNIVLEIPERKNGMGEWKAITKETKEDQLQSSHGENSPKDRVGIMQRNHVQMVFHVLSKEQMLEAAN